jgi:D-alanyl-lipoteichoic acid acyltransferase DltB (MBOAT superfamily)
MIFTSFEFILIFLPLAYAGFIMAHRYGGWPLAIKFLAAASLAFYGMWGLPLLLVLIGSILFNYTMGYLITCVSGQPGPSRNLLVASIAANLALLGYLKYSNFLIDVANQMTGASHPHLDLLVPIGVSFFTFIQIGYLIDAYNGQLVRSDLSRYIVFSAFFPCVTAGPLVLQREMMVQLTDPKHEAFDVRRAVIGITMFGMGLFKKVVLADSIAPYADQVFNGVAGGAGVDVATAWLGAGCYALQLYFDFSGYSDMALGLGMLFGIKLPLNFDSPFKATNISDFWRRWHMTMTRFFTNYIYSGLAMKGMRRAAARGATPFQRYLRVGAIPAIATFLVAGVWHGAGWTFVVYGLIHGLAIAGFLAWREFGGIKLPSPIGWTLTMAVVVSGLVVFRATDLGTAGTLLANMWGLGAFVPTPALPPIDAFDVPRAVSMIVLLGAITLLLPNTQQILHRDWPSSDTKPSGAALDAGLLAWRPAVTSAVIISGAYTIALTLIGSGSNFLYYQF